MLTPDITLLSRDAAVSYPSKKPLNMKDTYHLLISPPVDLVFFCVYVFPVSLEFQVAKRFEGDEIFVGTATKKKSNLITILM